MKAMGKLVLSLLVGIFCSQLLHCAGKRTAKDWSKMNLDDLEKQWENGDEEEELQTEQQLELERLERRRKEATASTGAFNPSSFKNMGADQLGALVAEQKDGAGPTMMFATVRPWNGETAGRAGVGEGDVDEVTKEETSDIAGRLQQLALLGGLELMVYALEPGSVLMSTQKGWESKEILDFLLSRPEVSKVTWNSKDFLPPRDEDEL